MPRGDKSSYTDKQKRQAGRFVEQDVGQFLCVQHRYQMGDYFVSIALVGFKVRR